MRLSDLIAALAAELAARGDCEMVVKDALGYAFATEGGLYRVEDGNGYLLLEDDE